VGMLEITVQNIGVVEVSLISHLPYPMVHRE